MPLTGDFAKLRKLKAAMAELARPDGKPQRDVGRQVVREVRVELREQFGGGFGPYGAWEKTKRGRPALLSRKLPQDFRGKTVPGGVKFTTRIPWLRAHHEGHVFPAHQTGGQPLFFNERGRLLRLGKLSARGLRTKFVQERRARQHTVGARVLPRRPMYPERTPLPTKWAYRVNVGAGPAMARWFKRANG